MSQSILSLIENFYLKKMYFFFVSNRWTIRLQQTCTVCDGVYIFKHRTTTGQDFVVNNRVFFRYEEPVVGEGFFLRPFPHQKNPIKLNGIFFKYNFVAM